MQATFAGEYHFVTYHYLRPTECLVYSQQYVRVNEAIGEHIIAIVTTQVCAFTYTHFDMLSAYSFLMCTSALRLAPA